MRTLIPVENGDAQGAARSFLERLTEGDGDVAASSSLGAVTSAGRDGTEPLPLVVFRENEWQEVEEE